MIANEAKFPDDFRGSLVHNSAMNSEELSAFEAVKAAIHETTGRDTSAITPSLRITKDLALSSLDLVEVFYEVSRSTKKDLKFRDLFFQRKLDQLNGPVDLTIQDFICYIATVPAR